MRLSVDSDFVNGPKNKRLARKLGASRFQTAGQCLEVWSACYITRSPFLVAEDVDNAAELDGFADAMVAAELAERVPAGHRVTVELEFRDEVVPVTIEADCDCLLIAGVLERIEFLLRQVEKSRRGVDAKRRRPVGEPERQTHYVSEPAGSPMGRPAGYPQGQPARVNPTSSASSSASSSPSASASPSDLDRISRSPARARDPSTAVPGQAERAQLADRAVRRIDELRAELAAANGWTDVKPTHPMAPGIAELRARILEAGDHAERDVEHVLQVMFAEARSKNTVRYLDASAFEQRSWSRKLAMRVEDARANPKAAGSRSALGGLRALRADLEREAAS